MVLKDGDGLAQVTSLGRAAAELSEDLPALQLGVRALTGSSEFGVGAVGLLLGLGLVLALDPAG
ncbi:hypothetical protein GCM10010149_21250 [Nonomuraea roseoviolacea subsp. roseoviolacea]